MDYWQRQTPDAPLFPDTEWNKPERLDQAGRLGVIGGNKLGFAGVAESYQTARDTGAGEVRVLVPDALKPLIPPTMQDVLFAPTNHSGSLASNGEIQINSLSDWADGLLLAGDAGKNSQTAILYEQLIKNYQKPITITRDAIDLVQNSAEITLANPRVVLVASFAQVQRLLRSVYFPRMLTFSQALAQVVETLHKCTITYPLTIVTLHADNIIIAQGGQIITQVWEDPMRIWRGTVAARAASYLLWTPNKPLEAITASIAV